ncbi:Beta-hexosaminidase subunit beta [Penaeus vannamei]|uniref:beta-N-acetylhexosaminidase n=1 Tax=Penaeus vannamei TaxID=6689 RepID=A0A3R7LU22_PENVA|nr:Beta-hexosaminidase subunit beta [Penaeus vannamei]
MFASYSSVELRSQPWRKDGLFRGYLDNVKVNLIAQCEELPHRNMDEQYEIKIDSPDAPLEGTIISHSVWGILRGLESFSHLLLPSGSAYVLNSTQIMDFPRFSFRGLMLDTARHFLPVSKLKENLDLMAMNKLNVFHWHLVDDQSFPYESAAFPNLSKLGSYSSNHVYSAEDVADVVEYARLRGIRVLPSSTLQVTPNPGDLGNRGWLTKCYTNSTPDGTVRPDRPPTNDANYKFCRASSPRSRTASRTIMFIWAATRESNPAITQFMAEHNITGNYSKLEEIYITKLLDIVANLPTKNGYLVWQEVFDNGVEVAKDTVVHVWKSSPLWKQEIDELLYAGRDVLGTAAVGIGDTEGGHKKENQSIIDQTFAL